jgi:hypothetical protein
MVGILYGEVDDHYEKEQRELVVGLHDELSNQYLPRSVWLSEGSRKKVESFLRMSEELCSEFSAEIEARGYPQVKHSMERRVSKKLRPLKTEAESGLETELGEPHSQGWRKRLRKMERVAETTSTHPLRQLVGTLRPLGHSLSARRHSRLVS